MNESIISSINNVVKENDTLFLLGDLLFDSKSPEKYINLLTRFTCNNIILLYGNHDNRANLQEAIDHLNNNYIKDVCIYDYVEVAISKRLLCLMHFPIAVWNDRHMTSLMLHGHTHGKYNGGRRTLDVGIDNAYKLLKEYRTFNLSEILDICL